MSNMNDFDFRANDSDVGGHGVTSPPVPPPAPPPCPFNPPASFLFTCPARNGLQHAAATSGDDTNGVGDCGSAFTQNGGVLITSSPRQRLRRLQWTKLPNNVVVGSNNVWTTSNKLFGSGASNGSAYPLDFARMEQLFSVVPPTPPSTTSISPHPSGGTGLPSTVGVKYPALSGQNQSTSDGGRPASAGRMSRRPSEEINLLDSRRSLNVNVFLRQFRSLTFSELIQILARGESSTLGAEKLRCLSRVLPAEDDKMILTSFSGDRTRLGSAEQFCLALIELPHFELRVEAMLLREEFRPSVDRLKSSIEAIIHTATELKNNERLHEVLYMVLVAGNFLNAGGHAGDAVGFRLSSLLALTDLKANKPNMTLLHYVALEAEEKKPELLKFPDQLPHLRQAAECTVESVRVDVALLSDRFDSVSEQLRGIHDSVFLQTMSTFLRTGRLELSSLKTKLTEIELLRVELSAYYCEDDTTFQLDDAFKVWYAFSDKFRRAVRENVERRLAEERAAERRRQNEQRLARQDDDLSALRRGSLDQSRDNLADNADLDCDLVGALLGPTMSRRGRLRRSRSVTDTTICPAPTSSTGSDVTSQQLPVVTGQQSSPDQLVLGSSRQNGYRNATARLTSLFDDGNWSRERTRTYTTTTSVGQSVPHTNGADTSAMETNNGHSVYKPLESVASAPDPVSKQGGNDVSNMHGTPAMFKRFLYVDKLDVSGGSQEKPTNYQPLTVDGTASNGSTLPENIPQNIALARHDDVRNGTNAAQTSQQSTRCVAAVPQKTSASSSSLAASSLASAAAAAGQRSTAVKQPVATSTTQNARNQSTGGGDSTSSVHVIMSSAVTCATLQTQRRSSDTMLSRTDTTAGRRTGVAVSGKASSSATSTRGRPDNVGRSGTSEGTDRAQLTSNFKAVPLSNALATTTNSNSRITSRTVTSKTQPAVQQTTPTPQTRRSFGSASSSVAPKVGTNTTSAGVVRPASATTVTARGSRSSTSAGGGGGSGSATSVLIKQTSGQDARRGLTDSPSSTSSRSTLSSSGSRTVVSSRTGNFTPFPRSPSLSVTSVDSGVSSCSSSSSSGTNMRPDLLPTRRASTGKTTTTCGNRQMELVTRLSQPKSATPSLRRSSDSGVSSTSETPETVPIKHVQTAVAREQNTSGATLVGQQLQQARAVTGRVHQFKSMDAALALAAAKRQNLRRKRDGEAQGVTTASAPSTPAAGVNGHKSTADFSTFASTVNSAKVEHVANVGSSTRATPARVSGQPGVVGLSAADGASKSVHVRVRSLSNQGRADDSSNVAQRIVSTKSSTTSEKLLSVHQTTGVRRRGSAEAVCRIDRSDSVSAANAPATFAHRSSAQLSATPAKSLAASGGGRQGQGLTQPTRSVNAESQQPSGYVKSTVTASGSCGRTRCQPASSSTVSGSNQDTKVLPLTNY